MEQYLCRHNQYINAPVWNAFFLILLFVLDGLT